MEDNDITDIWNISESALDNNFIGMWTITILDSFNTPKSGEATVSAVVRSKVLNDNILLYAYIPKKFDVNDIILDGSIGIYSKITEKINMGDNKGTIGFMFLYAIKSDEIVNKRIKYKNGYTITYKGEIDDIVYNSQLDYTFEVIYYLEGIKNPVLRGLRIAIPIEKFNHYVNMRNLFYIEYTGAKSII